MSKEYKTLPVKYYAIYPIIRCIFLRHTRCTVSAWAHHIYGEHLLFIGWKWNYYSYALLYIDVLLISSTQYKLLKSCVLLVIKGSGECNLSSYSLYKLFSTGFCTKQFIRVGFKASFALVSCLMSCFSLGCLHFPWFSASSSGAVWHLWPCAWSLLVAFCELCSQITALFQNIIFFVCWSWNPLNLYLYLGNIVILFIKNFKSSLLLINSDEIPVLVKVK